MVGDQASSTQGRPLRLFVAVEAPEDVRELVRTGVEPIRERHPKGRWVPNADQHVTLKFLGTVSPSSVAPAIDAIGGVAARYPPFETRVRELGAFPSARRARTLWVGLDDPASRLARLAVSLDEALARDFPPEDRAFTPHLTVARFDPPVPLEDLGALALESRPFDVSWLTLYRSHLRRPAPRYEALATFPLAG